MIPTTIKYHGQVYKLAATKHKRCKKKTHWNEAAKQCLKLPPRLQRLHQAAQAASATAYQKFPQIDDDTRDLGSNKLERAHRRAEDKHRLAAYTLHDHGFHELALHHEELANDHSEPYELAYHSKTGKPGDFKTIRPPVRSMLNEVTEDYKYPDSDQRAWVLRNLNRAMKRKGPKRPKKR